MLYFESLDAVPTDFGPSAVAIGKFDGLHAGHRRVLGELQAVAAAEGLVSTVVTFDRHPLSVLQPGASPRSLVSPDQKRESLEASGIDATVVLAFTPEFSQLSPAEFVQTVLVDALHASVVFIGTDFGFGRDNQGSIDTLRELGEVAGFTVRPIAAVRPDGVKPVSSTWIRDLLASGAVHEAAELLGRRPTMRGEVVHGMQRGRELGYPTANLSRDSEGYIPADGVYAAWATIDGVIYPAAVSIGNNPTFEGVPAKQVEAYILDETFDLYGKVIELAFVAYVRGMLKFDGIDELILKVQDDERQVREILGVKPRE